MYTVTRVRGFKSKEEYTLNECMSVRSWVNAHVGPEFPAPMICMYQGKPLLRSEWENTIIMADVAFIPLPLGGGGGGGKNVIATIASFVVAIIATIAAIFVPALWGLVPYTWQYALASAFIATAITLAGSLLVQALFPTIPPSAGGLGQQSYEAASPTYSSSVSQNQARLYQMIPESFGTNDMVPDLAAQYWAEFQGNEQYLHVLL